MTLWLELAGPGAGAWLPFLIDVALKGAFVLLLALVATAALRGASASSRHGVWTLAFAAVLALPLLAAMLPSWRVTVPGWRAPTSVTATDTLKTLPAPVAARQATDGGGLSGAVTLDGAPSG